MAKSPQETQDLIEKMAVNNYQWANKRYNLRRLAGMIEIDTINMLSAQMNNMMEMLNRQAGCDTSSFSIVHVACCFIYGGDHESNECVDLKRTEFVNNYNRNA